MMLAAVSIVRAGVTFSAPAAPAARLLPELGKVAGVTMEVAPALAREVLVLSVRDVPLADLMGRVAQAVGGEWTQKDGVERLVPNASATAKDRRAEAAERESDWLLSIRQRLNRSGGAQSRGGGQSTVEALLARLPSGTLGDLGFKTRIVLSTRPTDRQRPLPESALQGLDLKALDRADGPEIGGASVSEPGVATGAQLVLQTQGSGTMLRATLTTVDARGRTVGYGRASLFATPMRRIVPARALGLPKPSAPVQPSEEERRRATALAPLNAYVQLYGMMSEESESGEFRTMYSDADLAVSPIVRQVPELLQPEKTEPLALTAGPLLSRIAEAEGLNLVANLPDGLLLPAGTVLATSGLTADRAVSLLQKGSGLGLVLTDGWLVGRPDRPVTTRATRLDRAALGTALRALVRDGEPSLDAQATYAAAQPLVDPSSTFEGALFGAVDSGYGKRIAATCTSGARLVLRLYRAVGPPGGGGTRTVGSLPEEARTALEALVYDSADGPNRIYPYKSGRSQGTVTVFGGADATPWSLDMERTVFWPDGIPAGVTFRETEETTPAIFGLAASGAKPRMDSGFSGYSINVDARMGTTVATALPRLDRYARGTVRRISFSIVVPNGANFSRGLQEERIDPKAPTLAYGDLPEDLRGRIEALEEQTRKALDNVHSRPTSNKP